MIKNCGMLRDVGGMPAGNIPQDNSFSGKGPRDVAGCCGMFSYTFARTRAHARTRERVAQKNIPQCPAAARFAPLSDFAPVGCACGMLAADASGHPANIPQTSRKQARRAP